MTRAARAVDRLSRAEIRRGCEDYTLMRKAKVKRQRAKVKKEDESKPYSHPPSF
jgi:hypothetical protein